MNTDIKYKETIISFLNIIYPDWATEEDRDTFNQIIFEKCGVRLGEAIEYGMINGASDSAQIGRIKGIVDSWVIK